MLRVYLGMPWHHPTSHPQASGAMSGEVSGFRGGRTTRAPPFGGLSLMDTVLSTPWRLRQRSAGQYFETLFRDTLAAFDTASLDTGWPVWRR